jgi:hypothetical protein
VAPTDATANSASATWSSRRDERRDRDEHLHRLVGSDRLGDAPATRIKDVRIQPGRGKRDARGDQRHQRLVVGEQVRDERRQALHHRPRARGLHQAAMASMDGVGRFTGVLTMARRHGDRVAFDHT